MRSREALATDSALFRLLGVVGTAGVCLRAVPLTGSSTVRLWHVEGCSLALTADQEATLSSTRDDAEVRAFVEEVEVGNWDGEPPDCLQRREQGDGAGERRVLPERPRELCTVHRAQLCQPHVHSGHNLRPAS